jgi:hypothetical protein
MANVFRTPQDALRQWIARNFPDLQNGKLSDREGCGDRWRQWSRRRVLASARQ